MDISKFPIGQRFQEETKYISQEQTKKPGGEISRLSSPAVIPLPPPRMHREVPFWSVLGNRRSVRDYSPSPLSLEELSDLLFATQGVTEEAAEPWYRTVPSAGALHPIDTYLVVHRVQGLEPGLYSLRARDFRLEMRARGDLTRPITRAALGQDIAQNAAVVFIWVAVVQRSRQKYRQRAYRYIYLDCGHICQNLYLAAGALNLGCCAIAAFFDGEVNELLGVDGQEETAIYLATVGKKRRG